MALRSLPDPWRVFWSVKWQGDRAGRQSDGEADFILLHPNVGFIFLEVKGGGVSVSDGHWYSFDRKGERHGFDDPFEQAKLSKYDILGQLKSGIENCPFLPAGHAVVFPDLSTVEKLGTNAPEELMIHRLQLSKIEVALQRVVEHWELKADLTDDIVNAITGVLAPDTELRHTLADDVAAAEAQIEFWTSEQLEALDSLRRFDRQIIYGGAGTGKTVLAKEKARRLAAEGKSVLLTCYNGPLAAAIKDGLKEVQGIDVASFHGLCRRLSGQASSRSVGIKDGMTGADVFDAIQAAKETTTRFDFPNKPSQEFWDAGAPDVLVAAADEVGYHVDSVVVDEGQDFAPSWWEALELLLTEPEKGEFYVFSDTHQAIYRDSWSPPFETPGFELRKNCRNTLPIAAKVASIFGDEPSSLGASGADPEFFEVASSEGVPRQLRSLLHRLLNEGRLKPSQVAVLCQRKADVESLRGLSIAGTMLGDARTWGDAVLVETIHRFKGLEADVAIVVLWDFDRLWDRSLAYIGLSRPRAQLFVIGPPTVGAALGWT